MSTPTDAPSEYNAGDVISGFNDNGREFFGYVTGECFGQPGDAHQEVEVQIAGYGSSGDGKMWLALQHGALCDGRNQPVTKREATGSAANAEAWCDAHSHESHGTTAAVGHVTTHNSFCDYS